MAWFPDSWHRIKRAVTHANSFRLERDRIIHPNAYTTSIEMNTDWTGGIAKASPTGSTENDMALELGEFFYQLRAALDATMYQTAVFLHSSNRPPKEDSIEFPLYPTLDRFNRNPVNAAPFPKELRDWLEAIQPYNIAKPDSTDFPGLCKALKLLHDCARKDRHRKLHVVAAVPVELRIGFDITGPGKITFQHGVANNLLENEAIFLTFGFEGGDPKVFTNIRLTSEIAVNVTIDEIPISDGNHIGHELSNLVEATKFVVKFFEDCFS